jgi:hypothetical protein
VFGTVVPMAVRDSRPRRMWFGFCYTAMSALGGLCLWLLLRTVHWAFVSVFGAVTPRGSAVVLLIGATYLLAHRVQLLRLGTPMRDSGLPIRWRHRFGPRRASLAYAGLLGFGLTTRINNLCFYLVLLYGVFGVSSMAALIGTLMFSVTRAGVLLLAARTVGGEYHDDPEQALSRLTRWRSGTAELEVVFLVAVVVATGLELLA